MSIIFNNFFQCIDVYLNTSIGEAFGLSTVEAMKYGKPVVVSKVSGNIDIVDENNTGLFFQLAVTFLDNRKNRDFEK
jgi:glycosyltransferase involved in cell wall biosynthesis